MSHQRNLLLNAAILSILYSANTFSADAAATTTDNPEQAKELATVSVIGRGQTRQVTGITATDIADSATGSSPLKVLSKLPGVNFSSADSLGNYEWGSRISIRGFNQNQLGFTLDDVPLGDMSYRNFNGLHISRAISSENIGKVLVSQGTGALGTASTSNLGGTIQFYSLDPSDKAGGKVEQSVGEYAALHTFARYDSGLIGNSNTKVAVSITDHGQDKWKGDGEQKFTQINSKLVSTFDNAKFSAFMNWSNRQEADYMDLSKDSIKRLGYKWDYYAPDWNAAINSANQRWAKGETSEDDAYYNGSGLRDDKLTGATLDYKFNDKVSVKTTAYHHDQEGTGTWWLPNPPAGTQIPVALRTLEFGINRTGVLSAVNINAGIHSINAGIWYESNTFDNAMRFYSQDGGPTTPYERPSNPYFTRWNYQFQTDTIQLHAQDTVKLTDRLTANFGFKSPHTTTSVKSHNDTAADFRLNGELTAEKSFLPQGGVNFKIDDKNELFADAAQNIRAYRGVIKGGASPFDVKQAGFDAIKSSIKPEESFTQEVGWRFRNRDLETSLTGYHVEFKNRLLAIQQGSAIAGNASVLANVGRVETFGLEGFLAWTPITNVKWSNSISYNESHYKDDFVSDGVTFHTAGKNVVDAPKIIFNSQVAYDDGNAFGHVGTNFLGRRYYSFVNDNYASSYELWDIGGGYRWHDLGPANELSVKFSVNNLLDKKYYALGDNPAPASDPNGTSYNLLAGAPRTAFFTVGAKF